MMTLNSPSPILKETTAVIRFISGSQRGRLQTLGCDTLFVVLTKNNEIRIVAPEYRGDKRCLAVLHLAGNSYEIERLDDSDLWINGEKVPSSKRLGSGDLIEFDEVETTLRFRLYPRGAVPHKSLADAFRDSADYVQKDAKSVLTKPGKFTAALITDLATKTNLWFRFGVLIFALGSSLSLVFLYQQNQAVQQQLSHEKQQMEQLSQLLSETKTEVLKKEDLEQFRSIVDTDMQRTLERVVILEAKNTAVARVIASAASSVAFLHGRYGFVDPDTGGPLYFAATPGGVMFYVPKEDGNIPNGREVQIDFSGTAFVFSGQGYMLTNRHVVSPWLTSDNLSLPNNKEFVPRIIDLRTFLPGREQAFVTSVETVNTDSDLAVLKIQLNGEMLDSLSLATTPPGIGEEVIVMGYPLGISGMMARASKSFFEKIDDSDDQSYSDIVNNLALQDYITPLSTTGIISQLSERYVVYDAATAIGGSGGPVLTLEGKVIGVNTAIMKEFGGSNLGVPVYKGMDFISAFDRSGEQLNTSENAPD